MCTVSFIPLKDQFILTSNRDEFSSRTTALDPKIYEHNGIQLIYPKDPQGNGSWIALRDNGDFVCLLNGAFEPHERILPYRKSRGLVVIEFFEYKSIQSFFTAYDFENIEPFTLIILKNNALHEFRWDGNKPHLKALDKKQAYIYSSAPLYTKEMIASRERWFADFLKTSVEADSIFKFHTFGGDGDIRSNIKMEGKGKLTVSISQITMNDQQATFHYLDLLSNKKSTLNFKKEQLL